MSINGGAPCPAWYDIKALEHRDPESLSGFKESRSYIVELIEALRKDFKGPLVVGGFSQGGAVATSVGLSAALLDPQPVGVFGLSTYVVTPASSDAASIPLFWGHGLVDDMVQHAWGQKSFEKLKSEAKLTDCTFKSYKMGHEICMEELADLGAFLKRI